MKLSRVIKKLKDCNLNYHLRDFSVKGISANSKTVSKDFIFVAIKGTNANGNAFIDEALEKGAGAVVVDSSELSARSLYKAPIISVNDTRAALSILAAEFYRYPAKKINISGITGTNGKTTISYLMEAILKKARKPAAVIGTINYRFKNKVFASKNTTPGPLELESMFSQMAKEKIKYAVMEVSSHALDQQRVGGINFSSAIFTNLTQDHLDYHKTLGNYFQAKAKLFRMLKSDAFAVINNDDGYAEKLKSLIKAKVITYAIDNPADVRAEDINFGISHTEFTLVFRNKQIKLNTHLIGRHNVYNILAAFSWAIEERIPFKAIKSAIEDFSCVPGRLERVETKKGFAVFVDYAHTDDALKNVIRALRGVSSGKIIVVFGCGGCRDKLKRPKMGRIVTELADYAVITNDNPRSENPRDIIVDIRKGIKKKNYRIIPQRRNAILSGLSLASRGDIVLVTGKGHENYQIIKNKVLKFDDRKVVRECLKLVK